jgi:predicted SAM-dependent methyltransferase
LLRVTRRLKLTKEGQLKSFSKYLPYLDGKRGLEIGGPSDLFREGNVLPAYEQVGSLDNCDFSKRTTWTSHDGTFTFSFKKTPGKTLICDGSDLFEVADSTYDFVLSSHNLEHFANPVKALKEWHRVLKPTGALVLVLPYYRDTFDHQRQPTSVEHMLNDFHQGTGEDDLTHLDEILEKHDLTKDISAGSRQNFLERSLDNASNRCLHHHVFDDRNSRELLSRAGFEVLSIDLTVPPSIFILSRAV